MKMDVGTITKLIESNSTILILGETGTGKSTLLESVYEKLKSKYKIGNLVFYIFDFTRVEFLTWKEDPYLGLPVIYDLEKSADLLKGLCGQKFNKRTVIHIEECDLAYHDIKILEAIWSHAKNDENLTLVFSTSRPSENVLTNSILRDTDIKIIFKLSTAEQSKRLVGYEGAELLKLGESIVEYGNNR